MHLAFTSSLRFQGISADRLATMKTIVAIRLDISYAYESYNKNEKVKKKRHTTNTHLFIHVFIGLDRVFQNHRKLK